VSSYRKIFAVGEFRSLFVGNGAVVAGKTMEMLALSTLLYAATGSTLLAAFGFVAGFLPQAFGAMTLLSLADRVPPRAFLAGWDTVRAVVTAVLASGVLPVWSMLALVIAVGTVDAVTAAIRSALLAEVLTGDDFILGRSVFNLSAGGMQIVGFAAGGTVLAMIGPRQALLTAAILALFAAATHRFGLRMRSPTATGRATVRATWRGNRRLLADPLIRTILITQWVPNGLVVGAEAMAVPYAGHKAGLMFTGAAIGMMSGDLVVGRFVPARYRERLVVPLYALLTVPYLAFLLRPGVLVGTALVAVASVGFATHLGLQQRLLAVLPIDLRGQGFGLAGSGMMTTQALGAATVGGLAQFAGPAVAMAAAAGTALLALAAITPALRHRNLDPVLTS
jgi:MFS family permease